MIKGRKKRNTKEILRKGNTTILRKEERKYYDTRIEGKKKGNTMTERYKKDKRRQKEERNRD